MEIYGNSATTASLLGGPRDVPPADPSAAEAGAAGGERAERGGGARVALSERARGALAVKRAVDQVPDVRETHVDELRERIGAGTYDVRGKLVAEALARHALVEAVA